MGFQGENVLHFLPTKNCFLKRLLDAVEAAPPSPTPSPRRRRWR